MYLIEAHPDDRGAPGGILTVVTIKDGPLAMSSITVSGTSNTAMACTWNHSTGDLAPGDQLSCGAAGTVVITDSTHQVLLYSGSFS